LSKDRLFFVFDHQTGLRLRSDWQHLGKTKKNGHPERSRRTDYFLFSIIKMVFDYAQTDNTWGKQKEWSSWAYSKDRLFFVFDHQTGLRLRSDWQHLGKTKKNGHPERSRRTGYFFVFDHQTGLRLRSDWQHLGKTKKNGHPERSRRPDYFLFSTIKLVFDYAQTDNTCASVNNIALTRSSKY